MKFEDLEAWKAARVMVRHIYGLTRSGPLARDFGLCDQLQRAGVSSMSNLAEGFERIHLPEKLQYYNVARASTGETRSLLYVIEDNYPEAAPAALALRAEAITVGQLTSGLIRSTEQRKSRGQFLGWLLALLP